MSKTYYSEEHEWIAVDGDSATIGITNYAQEQLGDVVFVELPDVGKTLSQGDEAAVIESVKAASEAYAAVSGEVTEVNHAVEEEPGKVNESPEKEGWFFKLKLSNSSELDKLMDAEAYRKFVEGLD